MEELLGVIASNINMQGQDGKTFRTEAAKTLLALTQDASQVDALVDGGAQAHAVATALARTREGARDGLAKILEGLAKPRAPQPGSMESVKLKKLSTMFIYRSLLD